MKKITKVLMIIMLFIIFVPSIVYAQKQCYDYEVDDCPTNVCKVEDGVCVKKSECEKYKVKNCPKSRCKVEDNKCVTAHVGDDFCEQKNVLGIMKAAGYIIVLLKLAIPLIIIILGTIDMFKAVTAGDSLGKQAKSLGVRVALGILIFFIPSIVDAVLGDNKDSSGYNCQVCVLNPGSTECVSAINAAKDITK